MQYLLNDVKTHQIYHKKRVLMTRYTWASIVPFLLCLCFAKMKACQIYLDVTSIMGKDMVYESIVCSIGGVLFSILCVSGCIYSWRTLNQCYLHRVCNIKNEAANPQATNSMKVSFISFKSSVFSLYFWWSNP